MADTIAVSVITIVPHVRIWNMTGYTYYRIGLSATIGLSADQSDMQSD